MKVTSLIFSSFRWLSVILASAVSSLGATWVPEGFTEEIVESGEGIAGVVAGPNAAGTGRRLYIWEAGGKVWTRNDAGLRQDIVDISAELGPYISLLGFALDPAFQTNGYIYLLYTVDRTVLMGGGAAEGPTIGRLTRYTCRASDDFLSVDPASRKILIGETTGAGIPVVERSHGMGCLQFAADGTLLVSTGDAAGGSETQIDTGGSANAVQAVADGIIPAAQNVGAWRAQSLDCLSGKILRIDPATGNGVAGNPFFQSATPRSARSRVWASGLRNPYRFTIKPGSGSTVRADARPGTIVLGDAGWNSRDSLHVCTAGGQNFGWPAYEGFDPAPGYSGVTPPSFVNTASRVQPVADWSPSSARVRHGGGTFTMAAGDCPVSGSGFGGKASIGGAFVPAEAASWPMEYRGRYFHMDWGSGGDQQAWVRSVAGVDTGSPSAVELFGRLYSGASHMHFDPATQSLYCVEWPYTVRRITPAPARRAGLLQERFANTTLSGNPVSSIVPALDFGSTLGTGAYSVRWSGYILGRTDGPMQLVMNVNDRAKVWIDGGLVLDVGTPDDNVADYWLRESAPLLLDSPSGHRIVVEYANDAAGSQMTLMWQSAAVSLRPVPASSFQTAADIVPPFLQLTAPASATGLYRVYVAESETFTALTGADFTVTGGTFTRLEYDDITGDRYAVITPAPGSASVSVQVPAGKFRDMNGLSNTASNTVTTSIAGGAALSVTLSGAYGSTHEGPAAVQIVTDRPVTGLEASDFIITNGTATGLSLMPGGTAEKQVWLLAVSPVAAGNFTVQLPAGRCTDATGASNTASAVLALTYAPPTGPGLLAEYFRGDNLDTLLFSQSGSEPQRRWNGSPDLPGNGSGVPEVSDHFSVRWSGKVIPRYTETYRFIFDHDDGVRLWVNGVNVYDAWTAAGVRWQQQSAAISLIAGREYDFRLEFRDIGGDGQIFVFWESASQPRGIILADRFRSSRASPGGGDTSPPAIALEGPPAINDGLRDRTTGGLPVAVTVRPSEPVSGLIAQDFILAGCFLDTTYSGPNPIQANADGTWTLFIHAWQDRFSVSLPSGVCADAAGNLNTASGAYTGVITPVVNLFGGYPVGSTPTPPGDFHAYFDLFDSPAGLSAPDFIVTNGSVLSLVSSGSRDFTRWIATIRPAAPGTVTVRVPAAAFTYPLGTPNAASNTLSVNYAPGPRPSGVAVTFFSDPALTTSVAQAVLPNINADWGLSAPAAGVPADQFSARFTGCVIPPLTGSMTFHVRADDGARLWLNNTLAFDQLAGENSEWSSTISVTSGIPVAVRMEYREGWGGAGVMMSWSAAGLPKQIIPSSRWLVNESGLPQPILISAEDDAAAALSQVPASWNLAYDLISAGLQPTLTLSQEGAEVRCVAPASIMPWLILEESTNLAHWQTVVSTTVETTGELAEGEAAFSAFRPMTDADRTFYRIRVARIPAGP